MSNDEETVVRERLRRLMPGARMADGDVPPLPVAEPPSPSRLAWPTVLLPVHADRPRLAASDPAGGAGPRPARPESLRPAESRSDPPEPFRADGSPPVQVEPVPEMALGSRLPGPGVFDPGRRGVRALAVVAVLVVLAAAGWAWRSRPQVEPIVAATDAAVSPDPAAPVGAGPAAPAGAEAGSTASGELVVAVAGKVRRPGLVRVPAGARVADAVEAAGGALPGVDVAMLNPARKVSDGELILVGVPPPTPPPGAAQPGAAPAGDPASGGRVNLNTATPAQLETLPGVGPVLAQRIIAHRDQHGGFRSVGDLRQVSGIGDARYEQLKDLVTV